MLLGHLGHPLANDLNDPCHHAFMGHLGHPLVNDLSDPCRRAANEAGYQLLWVNPNDPCLTGA